MKVIFSLYLIWLPISFCITWYFIGIPPVAPSSVNFGFNSNETPHAMLAVTNLPVWPSNISAEVVRSLSHLPIIWKTTAGFIGLLGLGITMWMTCLIIKLFNRYSRKEIFDLTSLKIVRRIGILFFVVQIFNFFGRIFTTYLYTIQFKPLVALSFGSSEITSLVFGAIVFVISRIMYEGYRMSNRQVYAL